MSPSESDLRAALRDGEGDDAPDVDGVLDHARAHRAQRRTRVLSAAAAVVVVAAAGVGGAVLWGGSDHSGGTRNGPELGAGATDRRSSSAHAVPSGALDSRAQLGPSSSSASRTVDVRCPAGYPGEPAALPRVPSAADTGPMFASPVSSVIVCTYDATGNSSTGTTSGVASVALSGSDAAALADSIESASKAKLKVLCPDIASARRTQLAIIARTADGTVLPTVTTDVSIPDCNQAITNGTAVRYAWKPPASLALRISGLPGVAPAGGSGLNGSPAR